MRIREIRSATRREANPTSEKQPLWGGRSTVGLTCTTRDPCDQIHMYHKRHNDKFPVYRKLKARLKETVQEKLNPAHWCPCTCTSRPASVPFVGEVDVPIPHCSANITCACCSCASRSAKLPGVGSIDVPLPTLPTLQLPSELGDLRSEIYGLDEAQEAWDGAKERARSASDVILKWMPGMGLPDYIDYKGVNFKDFPDLPSHNNENRLFNDNWGSAMGNAVRTGGNAVAHTSTTVYRHTSWYAASGAKATASGTKAVAAGAGAVVVGTAKASADVATIARDSLLRPDEVEIKIHGLDTLSEGFDHLKAKTASATTRMNHELHRAGLGTRNPWEP